MTPFVNRAIQIMTARSSRAFIVWMNGIAFYETITGLTPDVPGASHAAMKSVAYQYFIETKKNAIPSGMYTDLV